MSEQRDVQALLRGGVEESRLGNRDAARTLFEKAVALDPQNEKAWLWLASVAESDQDQRSYLRRVLELNPSNDRAQRALDKLLAREKEFATEDAMPGVSRRGLTVLVGGGILLIIVVLGVIVALFMNNSNNQAAEQQATQVALAAVAAITGTAAEAERLAFADATATAEMVPTATETPFVPVRTVAPTWTPTHTATPFGGQAVALPTPVGLEGRLAGWSGRDLQSIGFLPVGVFNLADGSFSPTGGAVGRDVTIQASGQRLAYTRYEQVTFTVIVETSNVNGTDPRNIAELWREVDTVLEAQMPTYSPDGNRIAFIATEPTTQALQLYMVNLGPMPAGVSPLRRLTNDRATYTYPSISPDGRQIAVVRDDTTGPAPGPDIVIIDLETLTQRPLTTDYGSFIESSPRWSPDGFQIVYAAAASTEPRNNDIALRASAGYGLPTVPIRDPANDIFPVFSPDGRKIAFSSNRGGQYDIYIYDLETQSLSQLTNTPDQDYPGGWWQPAGS